MRIRPDGLELLRAARPVVETAIVPNLPPAWRDRAQSIVETMGRADSLLANAAAPSAEDLANLEYARAQMRGDVLNVLPSEFRYDARLVAKAIAVATRRLANGDTHHRAEFERLAAIRNVRAQARPQASDLLCALESLNAELCAAIRAGDADNDCFDHAAILAHLVASTHEALSESNPAYPRRAMHRQPGTIAARTPSAADGFDAWLDVGNAFGDAIFASGSAALALQTGIVAWLTQRLAANPRVPMLAVEGAHQMHDISLAMADASSAFLMLALAPFRFRSAENGHAHATRFR